MKSLRLSPPTTSTCWRERRSEEWRMVHSWSVRGAWRMLGRDPTPRNARNVDVRACCAGHRFSLRSLLMRTPKQRSDVSLLAACGLATAVAIDASSTSQKAPEPARRAPGEPAQYRVSIDSLRASDGHDLYHNAVGGEVREPCNRFGGAGMRQACLQACLQHNTRESARGDPALQMTNATSGVQLDWMATILQRTSCPNLLGHQSADSHRQSHR